MINTDSINRRVPGTRIVIFLPVSILFAEEDLIWVGASFL